MCSFGLLSVVCVFCRLFVGCRQIIAVKQIGESLGVVVVVNGAQVIAGADFTVKQPSLGATAVAYRQQAASAAARIVEAMSEIHKACEQPRARQAFVGYVALVRMYKLYYHRFRYLLVGPFLFV